MFEKGTMSKEVIRGALVEFLAMTLFVWLGTGSVVATGIFIQDSAGNGSDVARIMPIAMTFGIAIMVLIFAFGHISGGHINPAVTLCLMLVGECEVIRAALYMLAQFSGAVLGSLILWGCTSELGDTAAGRPPFTLGANGLNAGLSDGNGFLYEFMGTLLLCLTVLGCFVHKDSLAAGSAHNGPIAVGFAVFLAHAVLVPATGTGINPARSFGPAVVNSFAGDNVWTSSAWIYYAGPFSASVVAAALHKTLLAPSASVSDTPEKSSADAPADDVTTA